METSVKGGSLSLFCNGELMDFHIGDKSVSGSEDLLPKIAELLKNNKISKTEIKTIVISNGPGSFTGIRIGIATALALQKSLICECYGLDLLKAMALKESFEKRTKNILTAVSHGRNKICWFDFDSKNLNEENTYNVSDSDVLLEHIVRRFDNEDEFVIFTDSDVYQVLFRKIGDKIKTNSKLINAGENLSAILAEVFTEGSLTFEKPKPLYLNESNFVS